MTFIKNQNISLSVVIIIWILLLLPRVETAVRFTHHPPSVLYVQTGQSARFVWDYTVDNRSVEFGLNSPEWRFYDSQNRRSVIGSENGTNGWQWAIDYSQCPTRLLIPTVRISKESTATLVISNVTTADNGVYACTLVLSAGSSIVSKVQLIVTVPPGPVTITIDDVEASSITVRWTRPADNGGSPVTGFKVEVSTRPPVITVNTHTVITGLKANTQYTVKVYARNVDGYGKESLKVISTKKQGKPGVPQLTISITHTVELFVRLTWTKPDDNGGEIIMYTIYMKEKDDFKWTKVIYIIDSTVLEYIFTKSIQYGKNCTFLVTAWNKYGESVNNDVMAKTISIPLTKPTTDTNTSGYKGNTITSYIDTSGKHSKLENGRNTSEETTTNQQEVDGQSYENAIELSNTSLSAIKSGSSPTLSSAPEQDENGRNTSEETTTNQQEVDDETYENEIELRSASSSAMKSGSSPALSSTFEHDSVELQQPHGDQIHVKTIVNEIPCTSNGPSHYQELLPINTSQDHKRPVYEPLRTGVPRNDSDSTIPVYEPLRTGVPRNDSGSTIPVYKPPRTGVLRNDSGSTIPVYEPPRTGVPRNDSDTTIPVYEPPRTGIPRNDSDSTLPVYEPLRTGVLRNDSGSTIPVYEPPRTGVPRNDSDSTIPVYEHPRTGVPRNNSDSTKPVYEPLRTGVPRDDNDSTIPVYEPPRTGLPRNDNDSRIPVYEPLRTGVPRDDNETSMYQPLGLINQGSN
ncbi:titin-like isoform X2 [Actinia tenebrosa]|uniref:Titin-like isoform X2 n=1 Tax=Actinia tenebrosa TaxID=6105 RepID=A0A6P8H6K3_ACTTE|nr:titin-like isoform X2 [Actinia tenebrosa]